MHILKPFSDGKITSIEKALADLAKYIPQEDSPPEQKKPKHIAENTGKISDFQIKYLLNGRYVLHNVLHRRKRYQVDIQSNLLNRGINQTVHEWDTQNAQEYLQVGSILEYFTIFQTIYTQRNNQKFSREIANIKNIFQDGLEKKLMTLSTIKEVFPPIGFTGPYMKKTFAITHHSCNGKRESDNFAFENKLRFSPETENKAIQQTFGIDNQNRIGTVLEYIADRTFFETTKSISILKETSQREEPISLSIDQGKLLINYGSELSGVGVGIRFFEMKK